MHLREATMLMDGLSLLPGARIENAAITSGSTFPSADVGELFFRTTDNILYVYNGTTWNKVSGGQTVRNTMTGTLSTAATPVRMYPTTDMSVVSLTCTVSTAPAGADLLVDIRKNGVTILVGGFITIPAGSFKSSIVANSTAITTNDYITVHVVQVGSATAGADLVTSIYFV